MHSHIGTERYVVMLEKMIRECLNYEKYKDEEERIAFAKLFALFRWHNERLENLRITDVIIIQNKCNKLIEIRGYNSETKRVIFTHFKTFLDDVFKMKFHQQSVRNFINTLEGEETEFHWF